MSSTIVAYPGGAAAHSATACERLFPERAELVPLQTFAAVARATIDGDVAFGVLPIESSLAGPVVETHDILWDSPLSIIAETSIPINHCLLGHERIERHEVRVIRSHPSALEQCRRLLESMPGARVIPAATTAEAAAHAAESDDPAEVAIASERAAALYGLQVLERDVGDHPEAYTRFVSIATHMRIDGDGAAWRTAFSFVTDHRAGALHAALEPFARHQIDLVQLVSRPLPHTPFRYRFDAVLAGHPLDPETRTAIAEVQARVRVLRIFGSYPAGA